MSHYTDNQYKDKLPKNAKKDLKVLFFEDTFKHSQKILDIGCSNGRIIEMYPKKIEGIDIDTKALEIAKNKGLKVQYSDVTKELPFADNFFDGVYCSHLIEHLYEPLDLIKEVKRILKEEGKAVFITPDYIKTSKKYHKGFWSDYTHKRPFNPESLKSISYDAGFRDFRVYHFPSKGYRNLIRADILSKENWIKISKFFLVRGGNELILEVKK